MPIITISQGSYSRGKEVAEKVAEELGYEVISRNIIKSIPGVKEIQVDVKPLLPLSE